MYGLRLPCLVLLAFAAICKTQDPSDIQKAHGLTFVKAGLPQILEQGKTVTIPFVPSMDGAANEPITIGIARGGSADSIREFNMPIRSGIPATMRSIDWIVPNTIPPNKYYFYIDQGDNDDYSDLVQVVLPGYNPSTATSSTSTATPTSSPTTSSTTVTTSNPAALPASASSATSSGLSIGAKAGIGAGVGAGVLVLAAILAAFYYRRRYRTLAAKSTTEGSVKDNDSEEGFSSFGPAGGVEKPELDAAEASLSDRDSDKAELDGAETMTTVDGEKTVELDGVKVSPLGVFPESDGTPVSEMEAKQKPIEKEAEVVELTPPPPATPSTLSSGGTLVSPTTPGGHMLEGRGAVSPLTSSRRGTFGTLDSTIDGTFDGMLHGTLVSELDSREVPELPADVPMEKDYTLR